MIRSLVKVFIGGKKVSEKSEEIPPEKRAELEERFKRTHPEGAPRATDCCGGPSKGELTSEA